MSSIQKQYVKATVGDEPVRVVDPVLFYAAMTPDKGLGLFCKADLEPGDVWWAHDFEDRRFVERVIPWHDYQRLPESEKRTAEVLCYIDAESRSLIHCTEPFCRVNHSGREANSRGEDDGNSVVTKLIPAGTEITLPYTYELVQSILWKFPAVRELLPANALENEAILFSPVTEHPAIVRYLERL